MRESTRRKLIYIQSGNKRNDAEVFSSWILHTLQSLLSHSAADAEALRKLLMIHADRQERSRRGWVGGRVPT